MSDTDRSTIEFKPLTPELIDDLGVVLWGRRLLVHVPALDRSADAAAARLGAFKPRRSGEIVEKNGAFSVEPPLIESVKDCYVSAARSSCST